MTCMQENNGIHRIMCPCIKYKFLHFQIWASGCAHLITQHLLFFIYFIYMGGNIYIYIYIYIYIFLFLLYYNYLYMLLLLLLYVYILYMYIDDTYICKHIFILCYGVAQTDIQRGVSILWETQQIYRYLIISNSSLKSATDQSVFQYIFILFLVISWHFKPFHRLSFCEYKSLMQ